MSKVTLQTGKGSSVKKMWKMKEYVTGDEEERAESFLDEESEGLCSLSYTQVFLSSPFFGFFMFLFSVIEFGYFLYGAEDVRFRRLSTFGSCSYVSGMIVGFFFVFSFLPFEIRMYDQFGSPTH